VPSRIMRSRLSKLAAYGLIRKMRCRAGDDSAVTGLYFAPPSNVDHLLVKLNLEESSNWIENENSRRDASDYLIERAVQFVSKFQGLSENGVDETAVAEMVVSEYQAAYQDEHQGSRHAACKLNADEAPIHPK